MSEEEAAEYYINETINIGEYSFDIKLQNAVKVVATSLVGVTLLATNL